MTAGSQEVVTAFETLHMSPEEIADSMGYDLGIVKSILSQFSAVFRKERKTNSAYDYTDSEAEEAKTIILNLMRYSEDEHLQAKCAFRVMDEKKGRLDVQKQVQGLNINIVQFNEQLDKVRAARERSEAKVVDIEANKKLAGVA